MKNITTFAIGAVMLFSAGFSEAAPWNKKPAPSRHQHHHHQGYRHGYSYKNSTEYKAQVRLRQLGYYRGSLDGQFGRISRNALIRFQRDHRLPAHGRLDVRTIRALRIR